MLKKPSTDEVDGSSHIRTGTPVENTNQAHHQTRNSIVAVPAWLVSEFVQEVQEVPLATKFGAQAPEELVKDLGSSER